MARDSDVEFLGDDGRALGDEEELPAGPRRHVPRWVVIAAVVLAAAGATAAAVSATMGSSSHAAHRSPSAVKSSASSPTAANPAERAADAGVTLSSVAAVVDVAVAAGRLYVLQVDTFTLFDATSLHVLANHPVPPGMHLTRGHDRLVIDAQRNLGWIVDTHDTDGRVLAFEADTGDIETTITMREPIERAATLGGDLYFTTSQSLFRIVGFGIQPLRVSALPAAGSLLAADPTRNRLLVLTHAQLAALSPGGRVLVSAPTDVRHADVAVTGSTIWLIGDTARGAVIRTLDATTLQPESDRDIATFLGGSAEIVATGTDSVWLRGTDDSAQRLWCVDAEPGPFGPSWVTADDVASSTGIAFESNDAKVTRLPLVVGCTG